VAAILVSWALSAVKLKISTVTILLYPIAITSILYTAVISYINIRCGTMLWKDRVIRVTHEIAEFDQQASRKSLESASDASTGKPET
jgi:hypothetical protein